ncbi:DUF4268 domain-containing protein [Botrimarina sp.]|uniref:DUF4268 domain-containing protein n=1 Tax=Botrimarina sp. TaxID=2795802 RepID=UPI0032EE76A0
MSKIELGKLQNVKLRTAWPNEAADFTQWLAQEENLTQLGKTIELDLELVATEKFVGPFKADILCKNTLDGAYVVIENQLEKTDHSHLGQTITYAAGLEATAVVWIAARFTEEHRAALTYLNEHGNGSLGFFGLEIELWQIAGSLPAPRFNVVCKPNRFSTESQSAAKRSDSTELSELQQTQRRYWEAMMEKIATLDHPVSAVTPQPTGWLVFAIGRSQFKLAACMNTQEDWIEVALWCQGPEGKGHFALLEQDRPDIEAQIGERLEWRELPDRIESRIALRMVCDPEKESDWPRQHEWFADRLRRFYETFKRRVRSLSLEEAADAEGGID